MNGIGKHSSLLRDGNDYVLEKFYDPSPETYNMIDKMFIAKIPIIYRIIKEHRQVFKMAP